MTTGQSCAIIRPSERSADVSDDLALGVAPAKADVIRMILIMVADDARLGDDKATNDLEVLIL